MIYCKELDFKKSNFGRNKIAEIKRKYNTALRPVTDSMFSYTFLKSYFDQNNPNGSLINVTCYQTLLEFWVKDRYGALMAESELNEGNLAYEAWVKDNKNPLETITDLFKNIPVILALIAVIFVIKK
jgi:hypothetical protein